MDLTNRTREYGFKQQAWWPTAWRFCQEQKRPYPTNEVRVKTQGHGRKPIWDCLSAPEPFHFWIHSLDPFHFFIGLKNLPSHKTVNFLETTLPAPYLAGSLGRVRTWSVGVLTTQFFFGYRILPFPVSFSEFLRWWVDSGEAGNVPYDMATRTPHGWTLQDILRHSWNLAFCKTIEIDMGFMKVLVPKIGLLPFHPMIDTLPGWSSKMAFPLWAPWGPRHRFFF